MAPVGADNEPAADPMAEDGDQAPKSGGLGTGQGGYVPPHLRKGATASSAGERMGGKFERDDLATLRVTNVRPRPPTGIDDLKLMGFLGLGNGRRARTSRYVRALRTSHTSLPREGQRYWSCQRLCIHQFC